MNFYAIKGRPEKITMPGQRGKGSILTKSVPHEYALSVTENTAHAGKENVIKMMLF
ncbi:hypothetical protein [Serratia liquefaciens]|uniref:hypothetical protein n=1 Tax=Serratia liquefaciens TaxID=614 RepID=UPI000B2C04FF|nr:hypothetical protein [Serratia liquefaciens]